MRIANAHTISCETSEEAAAIGLISLMSAISEDGSCAAWLGDIEFTLWERVQTVAVVGEPLSADRQSTMLKFLAEECDGW